VEDPTGGDIYFDASTLVFTAVLVLLSILAATAASRAHKRGDVGVTVLQYLAVATAAAATFLFVGAALAAGSFS
jgi:hypothetical protein